MMAQTLFINRDDAHDGRRPYFFTQEEYKRGSQPISFRKEQGQKRQVHFPVSQFWFLYLRLTSKDEWETISDDCKRFIQKLLTVDPDFSYSAEEALNDPWIKEK